MVGYQYSDSKTQLRKLLVRLFGSEFGDVDPPRDVTTKTLFIGKKHAEVIAEELGRSGGTRGNVLVGVQRLDGWENASTTLFVRGGGILRVAHRLYSLRVSIF